MIDTVVVTKCLAVVREVQLFRWHSHLVQCVHGSAWVSSLNFPARDGGIHVVYRNDDRVVLSRPTH